jgi:two-component system sensor histidine kinase and response regulator WspE
LEIEKRLESIRTLPVIVIADQIKRYGIIVDELLGEKELVVKELSPHLGKVPDISAGAFLEDGSPLLIIDVDDLILSVQKFLKQGSETTPPQTVKLMKQKRKRILIVDDSPTVREVESRLLTHQGYEVETATNGVEGWNALRSGHFDLVITDIDMPRMNGIELTKAIKTHPLLSPLPVIIVSYKDREEDKRLGLEAGAEYCLPKKDFQGDVVLQIIEEMVGGHCHE